MSGPEEIDGYGVGGRTTAGKEHAVPHPAIESEFSDDMHLVDVTKPAVLQVPVTTDDSETGELPAYLRLLES